MSNITLTIPQWSTGTSTTLLVLTAPRVWTNANILTNDTLFGSLFSNSPNTIYLTGSNARASTPGNLFTLTDDIGNAYPLNLVVAPSLFTLDDQVTSTLSRPITYFLFDSNSNILIAPRHTNRPYTILTFPSSGSFLSNIASTIPVVSLRIQTVSYTNYNISPSLPIGLSSYMNGTGDVFISGTPITLRSLFTYTMFTRSDNNQTAITPFTLQVLPARINFSNISGTVLSDSIATSTINYKAFNDIRIGCSVAPMYVNYNLIPTGMAFSIVGANVILSGTPTIFAEPNFVINATVTSSLITSTLKYVLTMNPCLDIIAQPVYNVYPGVPLAIGVSIRGYPSACNSFFVSMTSALPNISINQQGLITGSVSRVGNAIVNVSGYNALSNRAVINFAMIQDSVTFTPINPLYTITQNVSFNLATSATAQSEQQLTYYTDPYLDGPIGLTINTSTGFITGIPRGISTITQYKIYAATPQGASTSVLFNINMVPDVLTFTPGYGLANFCSPLTSYLPLIQGRTVTQYEYPSDKLEFQSSTRSGDANTVYLSSNLPSGIALSIDGVLSGTPSNSGRVTSSILAATIDGIRSSISLQFDITPDMLIISSPSSLDFIGNIGDVMTYMIAGNALSGSKIVSYGITGGSGRVSITSAGQLTILTNSILAAVPFSIIATTLFGTILTKSATVTVNNRTARFISPTGSGLLLLPYGTTYPIQTSPNGFSFTISGSTDIGTSGSNLTRLTTRTIYPPQVISVIASSQLSVPVRVATTSITPSVVGDVGVNRWIQYVPVSLTLSATQPAASKVVFSVPNPPNGVLWNPINNTLTRAPNELTIQDAFTAYASDGYTTAPLTIQYSVGAPMYLRLFSAPSAYTNYVKQSAFIKAAVHAIDNTAFLPDSLIATQTGPYPVDETKDVICVSRQIIRYNPLDIVAPVVSYFGIIDNWLIYSYDAITWIHTTIDITDGPPINIAWNGTMFVASFSAGMMYSLDGIDWVQSPSNALNNIAGSTHFNVIWNGSIWVVALYGYTMVKYSTDGITWMAGNFPQGGGATYVNGGYAVCWTGTEWLLYTDVNNTTFYHSSDGITWYPRASPANPWFTALVSTGVACVGIARNNSGLYSADGITWSNITISDKLMCVESGNGMFVISVFNAGLYYSTGTNTWTAVSGANNKYFVNVKYNGKVWIATGSGIFGSTGIWYSTDGKNWSKVSNSMITNTNLEYYQDSWFTDALYSADGQTWNNFSTKILVIGTRHLQRAGAMF